MEDIEITSGTVPADITLENHIVENIKCEVAALYDQEIAEEFDKLTSAIDERAKDLKIKDNDIEKAIKWARRK